MKYVIIALLILLSISLFVNWNQSNKIYELENVPTENWKDTADIVIRDLDSDKKKVDSLVKIRLKEISERKPKIESLKKQREILEPCNESDSNLYNQIQKQLYEESNIRP